MSFTIKFDELKLSPCKREDEILKKCIHKTFNELNLHIEAGRFQYYNWHTIFKHNQELTSNALSLKRNYQPSILSEILHLKLPNLVTLNLSQNNISCIYSLTLLNAPNLKNLFLSENRLTSTKTLRKLPFKLGTLAIDGNLIPQLLHFSEISWDDSIKQLTLQSYQKQKKANQDLRILVKIKAKSLETLYMNKRINPNFFKDKIMKHRFGRHDIFQPKF